MSTHMVMHGRASVKKTKLAPGQRSALVLIERFWTTHGRPPSLAELGELGGVSKSAAYFQVHGLQQKGAVELHTDSQQRNKGVLARVQRSETWPRWHVGLSCSDGATYEISVVAPSMATAQQWALDDWRASGLAIDLGKVVGILVKLSAINPNVGEAAP